MQANPSGVTQKSGSSLAGQKSGELPSPCDLIDDFWQKSTAFYAKSDIQKLLLFLQNKYQYRVNSLLFCLWFSQMFKQLLDNKLITQSQAEIDQVEATVNQLRQQRHQLDNNFGKPASGNLADARKLMLEAELAIEKEIQQRLVNCLCDGKYPPINHISAETQVFLIDENISLLCPHRGHEEQGFLQKLSVLWIQQQDCYNQP